MRFVLSGDEWALLEPLMPKSRMSARAYDRKITNAICYVLRTGMPWRDLPERIIASLVSTRHLDLTENMHYPATSSVERIANERR
jgi:transposase